VCSFTGGLDMQEGTWIATSNSSSLPSSGLVIFTNTPGTNAKITVNTNGSIEALGGGNTDSLIDGNPMPVGVLEGAPAGFSCHPPADLFRGRLHQGL
jgi:hypothetical protein